MNNFSPEIIIERITKFSPKDAESINKLASELGPNYQPLTDSDLTNLLSYPFVHLFVARESKTKLIVGMATLAIYRIPYVKKAAFDDLIVDNSYRGQGIGKQLIEKVVAIANESGAKYVDFTSNPKRLKANKLYERLGFKKRDTNIYRLTFNHAKI